MVASVGDDKKKKAYVLAESKPGESGRDQAFITEANDLETYYKKNDPNTEVVVLPFYGEDEFNAAQEKIQNVSEGDEVFIFGHSGSKIGGIENTKIASALKDKGVKSCNLGSCNFENYADPYKENIQNVTYRGKDQWLGVNPNATNLMSAMYSTANNWDKGVAEIVKPEKGVHYNKVLTRPVMDIINAPERPAPSTKLPVASKFMR